MTRRRREEARAGAGDRLLELDACRARHGQALDDHAEADRRDARVDGAQHAGTSPELGDGLLGGSPAARARKRGAHGRDVIVALVDEPLVNTEDALFGELLDLGGLVPRDQRRSLVAVGIVHEDAAAGLDAQRDTHDLQPREDLGREVAGAVADYGEGFARHG